MSSSKKREPSPKGDAWAALPDEELLKLRICDLGLTLEGSLVEDEVRRFQEELAAKGLRIKPKVYFGDEWFSPEGMLAISVPFYLAHPRLRALEQKLMLEVEGGNPGWFMKLIRHEAGHCFDHGYRFSRRPRWRELFGSPEQEYAPETYHPRPYSRSFVQNLENWYAQSHPDEDFAETFAVWLNPGVDWAKEYKDWPGALAKLRYLDRLAKGVAERARGPRGVGGYLPFSAARMKTTLERYYARRKRENAQDYPDFFDGDLRRIFNGKPPEQARAERGRERAKAESAARFLRRNRRILVDGVGHWSGEKKFTIEALVRKLTLRCEELDLRMGSNEQQTTLETGAYLATLVANYLFTGKFKRTV